MSSHYSLSLQGYCTMPLGIVSRGYSIVPIHAQTMSSPARTDGMPTVWADFGLKRGNYTSVLIYTTYRIKEKKNKMLKINKNDIIQKITAS